MINPFKWLKDWLASRRAEKIRQERIKKLEDQDPYIYE